jgi:DNA polymerase III delta prime subunit
MMTPDELNPILERITQHQQTEKDLETLRRSLRLADSVVQSVSQDGKFNTNVGQIIGGKVHIGDRIYQNADAEAIKAVIQEVLQERRKRDRPRNEKLLLTAVKNEVKARLKQSLHNAKLIQLCMMEEPRQVKRLWDLEIKIGSKPPELLLEARSILEVFDQPEIMGRLLILGNPGAGKTTTMLELAQGLCNRAERDSEFPIPILFNLSTWENDRQSMRDWLIAELKFKYGVRKDRGAKWVDDTKLLPMLDGLDELESTRQETCVQALNQLLQSESRPQYLIVCSRQEEYKNYDTRLQLNAAICLQQLTEEQIQKYLIAVKHAALWQIFQQNSTLLELVKVPLLLNIVILIANELSVNDWQKLSSEEAQRKYLLDVYVQQMLSRGVESKEYSTQQTPTADQTQNWLSWLARQLNSESKTEFLIEKMQPSCLTNANFLLYKVSVFLVYELSYGVGAWLVYSPSYGGICGVIAGITFWNSQSITPFENFRWSWDKTKYGLLDGLKWGTIIGIIIGFVYILVYKQELFYSFVSALPVALVTGLIFTVFKGISGFDLQQTVVPNQGIWESVKNTIIFTFIVSCPIWITGYLTFAIIEEIADEFVAVKDVHNLQNFIEYFLSFRLFTNPLVFFNGVLPGIGLVFFNGVLPDIGFGIGYSGFACIQHFMLRIILYFSHSTPWNYARFLDYCTECLFLQRVGGRYRFIHRLLQEHFATMPLKQ